jgi:hypothetical protein
MPESDESALYIDGEQVTMGDLTFREQRTMRDIIRNLAPDNDPDNAAEADIIPALITVWKQRTDPKFSLDDALDFKPGDLDAPPTRKPAAKK